MVYVQQNFFVELNLRMIQHRKMSHIVVFVVKDKGTKDLSRCNGVTRIDVPTLIAGLSQLGHF